MRVGPPRRPSAELQHKPQRNVTQECNTKPWSPKTILPSAWENHKFSSLTYADMAAAYIPLLTSQYWKTTAGLVWRITLDSYKMAHLLAFVIILLCLHVDWWIIEPSCFVRYDVNRTWQLLVVAFNISRYNECMFVCSYIYGDDVVTSPPFWFLFSTSAIKLRCKVKTIKENVRLRESRVQRKMPL